MSAPLIRLVQGDCLDLLPRLTAGSVDAIVTDPPYGLGFMGKKWDALPPGVEVAEAMLRILKPGGHLLAFGGTRTFHRLACTVEDAGFELRDTLLWLHGQGLNKSRHHLKPAWEPIAMARRPLNSTLTANVKRHGTGGIQGEACRVTGGRWPANVVLSHLPECELVGTKKIRGSHDPGKKARISRGSRPGGFGNVGAEKGGSVPSGPSYVDEDGMETVEAWDCIEGCPIAMLDTQSGVKSDGHWPSSRPASTTQGGPAGHKGQTGLVERNAERGGASRFYYCAKASNAERWGRCSECGQIMVRTAWKTHRERHEGKPRLLQHPTVKPVALMRWLVHLVTPPGGLIVDPFTGTGTTLVAARAEGFDCLGFERDPEYVAFARARLAA